ncbi:hypothetical protein NDU88_003749 [Pleurodeles waltl]|uniref:Uncharacterized protein n=1 Tax=Pleurodeles waltl TaxID=8319 RepID=A0AAV7VGP4_PLEWA|nr:hypothetical protein NDU88_003749 [Pleurodeles waltl]
MPGCRQPQANPAPGRAPLLKGLLPLPRPFHGSVELCRISYLLPVPPDNPSLRSCEELGIRWCDHCAWGNLGGSGGGRRGAVWPYDLQAKRSGESHCWSHLEDLQDLALKGLVYEIWVEVEAETAYRRDTSPVRQRYHKEMVPGKGKQRKQQQEFSILIEDVPVEDLEEQERFDKEGEGKPIGSIGRRQI